MFTCVPLRVDSAGRQGGSGVASRRQAGGFGAAAGGSLNRAILHCASPEERGPPARAILRARHLSSRAERRTRSVLKRSRGIPLLVRGGFAQGIPRLRLCADRALRYARDDTLRSFLTRGPKAPAPRVTAFLPAAEPTS